MNRELNSKPSWIFPTIPKGYDTAAVTVYTSGTIELEYYGQKGWFKKKPKIYSHETGISPSWEWPWRDGYTPNLEDWKSLGFSVGRGFDCGANYPPEIKYRSWLNHPALIKS